MRKQRRYLSAHSVPRSARGSTVAPEVVYSPIVPVSKSVTKICAGIVPGMAQSAAMAAKRSRRWVHRVIAHGVDLTLLNVRAGSPIWKDGNAGGELLLLCELSGFFQEKDHL
jgi:hypothetical protein